MNVKIKLEGIDTLDIHSFIEYGIILPFFRSSLIFFISVCIEMEGIMVLISDRFFFLIILCFFLVTPDFCFNFANVLGSLTAL